MKKQKITLLFILVAHLAATRSAIAQVDAIPDPHQDFYQMRQPKKTPLSNQFDTSSGKDASDQNSVDLDGFRGQAQPPTRTTPGTDNSNGTATRPNVLPRSSESLRSNEQPRENSLPRSNDLNSSIMESMPPQAPDFRNSDGSPNEQTVQSPVFTHPELLPRPPIPAPPAVTLLPPMNGGQVKDSLSWRTRAYKIRSEGSDVKGGLVKGSRVVNAPYDDTLAALSSVCSSRGIVVDSVFEGSGQVLAHQAEGADDKARIIFSLKPVSKNSTLVRVGLDVDSHARQTSFDDLLNRIETAANEKGLL